MKIKVLKRIKEKNKSQQLQANPKKRLQMKKLKRKERKINQEVNLLQRAKLRIKRTAASKMN